jgi:hypothetical protein
METGAGKGGGRYCVLRTGQKSKEYVYRDRQHEQRRNEKEAGK